MTETWCKCGLFVLAMAFGTGMKAQTAPIPIKPGLWETTVNGTTSMTLPAAQQAQIAALPAAQQAMIRSRMGGGSPTTITTRACAAQQTTLNDIMSQAQQKNTKCTLSNQTQTASSASFDVSCVSPQGTASGHAQFQMADSDHVTGSMHLTVDASSNGGPMHMTIDNTVTSKYVGADCGTVKPGEGEVVHP
jgi:hypothetical protein